MITNKVKNGKLVINLELYFNDNLEIDNFIARGEVKEMNGIGLAGIIDLELFLQKEQPDVVLVIQEKTRRGIKKEIRLCLN